MNKNQRNKLYQMSIAISVIFGILSIIFGFVPFLSDFTLPSFLLAVFILLIEQSLKINDSLNHTEEHSSEMSNDVKNHLVVIKLDGSIAHVFDEYVIQRLETIKSIKNTSFNVINDHQDADELFNTSDELNMAPKIISRYISKGLIWEDIGDDFATKRFRIWDKINNSKINKKSNSGGYHYSILNNQKVPYPNFLIITYNNNKKEEVLFNWDVRLNGIEPEVLVSNENKLVEFYKNQFYLLRKNAGPDSDKL